MGSATDWDADGIGTDGRLRHVVPTPWVMRIFLIACGLFVLGVSSTELWRGVWPVTLFGLPFAIILIGAFAVGIPMILAGLLAPTVRWTVGPQRIDIALANPFREWGISVAPGNVAGLEILEGDGDGAPSTYKVELRTVAGKRYETREFQSRETADQLRRDIERIFYRRAA